MNIGIGFTPFETRADTIVELAMRADDAGLARVSVAEGWTNDAFILLAELALRTSRIELGSGVVSVWGRSPATLAMAAAGLQRASDGRFSLGLGAGSPPLAEGLHGIAWSHPTLRLRETLTAVRALLAGERLPNPAAGARPLRAGAPPEPPVPLVLAALAPGSIRLAGELADEWAPFLWARSRVAEGRALLAEGATPTRISACIPVALGPDEATARQLAAWWLTTYATRMGPIYPRLLGERFGMGAALAAVVDAGGELPAEAEELAREVTLMGTYDEAATAIGAWFAAGVDSVQLVLPPGRPEDELANVIDVSARAAAPTSSAI